MNPNINISAIETYLDSKLKGKVSKHVYAGNPPSTLGVSEDDFVVIDCGDIYDNTEFGTGEMGKGWVNVLLYAKPTANGRKNVALMSKMEKAFAEAIGGADGDSYKFSEIYSRQDYDSNYNMHFTVKALNILIS